MLIDEKRVEDDILILCVPVFNPQKMNKDRFLHIEDYHSRNGGEVAGLSEGYAYANKPEPETM